MVKNKKKTASALTRTNVAVFVIVALLVGWALGYAIGMGTSDGNDAKEVTGSEKIEDHKHGTFVVSDEEAPSVRVLADRDPKGGWNITLVTAKFEFTPEDVNGDDELGTGHAHIWVDGKKVNRLYANNYHLQSLGAGDHEITVTLNTNSHKDYVLDGEVIGDTIAVTETVVGDMHMHDDDEMHSHSQ